MATKKIPITTSAEYPNTNPDYLEYLDWLTEGNDPMPASPRVPSIPDSCTPVQGLISLFSLKGIKESDILAAIDGIEDPTERYRAKIVYGKASSWDRNSETVSMLAALLGLTGEDLDDLFLATLDISSY